MTHIIESQADAVNKSVRIPVGGILLEGELRLPENAPGVVLFAHGSGSSRHSPRNQFVAGVIREAGIGTLLFDLLTNDEERQDTATGVLRFDIALLAKRLVGATRWIEKQPETSGLDRATSVPARVAVPRSWRRRNSVLISPPLSRAEAARISRVTHCQR